MIRLRGGSRRAVVVPSHTVLAFDTSLLASAAQMPQLPELVPQFRMPLLSLENVSQEVGVLQGRSAFKGS